MRQVGAVGYVVGCLPEGRERHSSRRTLAGVIAIVLLAAVPSAGQVAPADATTAETTTGIPPRTPWGDPDLQGIWNNSTITPLERPSEFAGQPFLTEEEAAALEQGTAASRIDRPPRDGDTGTYNQFWFDRGTTVVPTRRTSLIVDPPSGRLPPLTPDAHRRVTSPEAQRLADARRGRRPADSWEDLDLSDRCIWYRGIPALPTGYNNNYHIVQTPEYVAILQEHIHDVRFIPLDGRSHVAPAIRQYMGDSRGRWEGETLVVDTTNFNNRSIIRGVDGDLSEALHVVERFTRVAADMLDYQFTVEDSQTWTSPWTGSLPMTSISGPLYEYACHEGNYGLTGILAGSRADERAAAEAATTSSR